MPESMTSFEKAFQQLHIPTQERYVSIRKSEGKFIHNWVGEHQLKTTLEIGLAYGASAVSIMSAHDGMHTCIDPFQEQSYQNIGLKNLETAGCQDRVVCYQDFSHNILPRLHAEGRKYDFIFVDGSHHFDHMFVDFYYANLLLSQNGYILFHDSWMRSTQLVASYIRHNHSNYVQISNTGLNLIMFQKSGIRHKFAWDDFKEFYTLRGMLSHLIIRRIIPFFKR